MQAPSWIALLQLIPTHLHDTLCLLTMTGVEVIVQRLLRVEKDYVVIRGRMSGTMDGGRVMILPYDQISNVAFNKRLTEAEVQTIFANSGGYVPVYATPDNPSADAESDGPAGDSKEEAAQETVYDQGAATEPKKPAADSAPAAKPEVASKSILLARLRARLAGKGK